MADTDNPTYREQFESDFRDMADILSEEDLDGVPFHIASELADFAASSDRPNWKRFAKLLREAIGKCN